MTQEKDEDKRVALHHEVLPHGSGRGNTEVVAQEEKEMKIAAAAMLRKFKEIFGQ